MPWWAIIYLVLFIWLTIIGIPHDLKRPNKAILVTSEIITAVFVVLFVSSFFYENIGNTIGIFIFPMLIAGVVHELFAAKRTLESESKDKEFTKKELLIVNNISLLLANLFIVPGYIFGLMVGLRNIGL